MLKTRFSWGETIEWNDMVKRAGGRRRWLGVRRLRATMRRHQLVRIAANEGLAYGCRVHWAERLGVSPATITVDLDIISRQHPQERLGGTPIDQPSGNDRRRAGGETAMPARVTLRLSQDFQNDLKRLAHWQGQSLARFIRQQLETVVAGSAGVRSNTTVVSKY